MRRLKRLRRKTQLLDIVAAPSGGGTGEHFTRTTLLGCYGVLRIKRTATIEEIRRAYKAQALISHPDKGGSDEAMCKVKEAFETLSDPLLRASYDLKIQSDPSLAGDGLTRVAPDAGEDSPDTEATSKDIVWKSCLRVARAAMETCRLGGDVDITNCSALELLALQRFFTQKGFQPASATSAPPRKEVAFRGIVSITRRRGSGHYEVSTRLTATAMSGIEVYTQSTSSLPEALDWQIALDVLQRSVKSGTVLEEAAKQAWTEAPNVQLFYRSRVANIWTPSTENPLLVVQHRNAFEQARARYGSDASAYFEKVKSKALNEIKANRAKFARRQATVLKDIDGHLLAQTLKLHFSLKESRLQTEDAENRRALAEMRQVSCDTAAQQLQMALHLDSHTAAAAAIKLRRLPEAELQRRRAALLAPQRAREIKDRARTAVAVPVAPQRGKAIKDRERPAVAVPSVVVRPVADIPWVSDWPVVVARMPVQLLTFFELLVFQVCARSAKLFGQEELWARCKHLSSPPMRSSRQGRLLRPRDKDSSKLWHRWARLLQRKTLDAAVECLDLTEVSRDVLRDQGLLGMFRGLPRLRRVFLPNAGWSDSHSKNEFIGSFRQDVRIEFRPWVRDAR